MTQETLLDLYNKLSRKAATDYYGARVGPGWLKYEYNETVWNLDDGECSGMHTRPRRAQSAAVAAVAPDTALTTMHRRRGLQYLRLAPTAAAARARTRLARRLVFADTAPTPAARTHNTHNADAAPARPRCGAAFTTRVPQPGVLHVPACACGGTHAAAPLARAVARVNGRREQERAGSRAQWRGGGSSAQVQDAVRPLPLGERRAHRDRADRPGEGWCAAARPPCVADRAR